VERAFSLVYFKRKLRLTRCLRNYAIPLLTQNKSTRILSYSFCRTRGMTRTENTLIMLCWTAQQWWMFVFYFVKFSTRTDIKCWFETFALFWMLYSFFWVIPQRLNFICRRFWTLFYLHKPCKQEDYLLTPPMNMGQTECSETSAYKIQKPGNHPKERIQETESGYWC
jgi:hypothetical protein